MIQGRAIWIVWRKVLNTDSGSWGVTVAVVIESEVTEVTILKEDMAG